MIDNSIFQGNPLNIDTDNVVFNRTLDVNDRALRGVVVNSGVKDAIERKEKFNITAACESVYYKHLTLPTILRV